MPEWRPTQPDEMPDHSRMPEVAYSAQLHINWAMGIAQTAAAAISEDDSDTRACFHGIAHLLREAAGELSWLSQFVSELQKTGGKSILVRTQRRLS